METESCLYKRSRHRAVVELLSRTNAGLLRSLECYFGRGTAIALLLDEFRESADVDFLCSSKEGYRALRTLLFEQDLDGLFQRPIAKLRDTRADMDGVRNFIDVNGTPVKFEIVHEARIALSKPEFDIAGAPALALADLFAEKLLQNTDRGLDRATASRDAIDLLALVHRYGTIPERAWEKSTEAYGTSVQVAWRKTLAVLQRDTRYFDDCLVQLSVDESIRDALAQVLVKCLAEEE